MSPQVTNITRDEDGLIDFSKRNFFQGKCIDKDYNEVLNKAECDHIEIENIDLVNTYPADMILLLNDHRSQFVSSSYSYNMEPVKVTVRIFERDRSDELEHKSKRSKKDRLI